MSGLTAELNGVGLDGFNDLDDTRGSSYKADEQ